MLNVERNKAGSASQSDLKPPTVRKLTVWDVQLVSSPCSSNITSRLIISQTREHSRVVQFLLLMGSI